MSVGYVRNRDSGMVRSVPLHEVSRYRNYKKLADAWEVLTTEQALVLLGDKEQAKSKIGELVGRFKGQPVFVVGGGPSVLDLSPAMRAVLAESITIGVNLPPFPVNFVVVNDDHTDLSRPLWQEFHKFVDEHKPKTVTRMGIPHIDGFEPSYQYLKAPQPMDSIEDGIFTASSTAQGAIELARFMGASPIILLGCDFNNRGHWYTGIVQDSGDEPNVEWRAWDNVVSHFKMIEADYAKRDVEVLNFNPDSKLRVFPFISEDEVLDLVDAKPKPTGKTKKKSTKKTKKTKK